MVTHARTRAAKFLGYQITVAHDDTMIGGKGSKRRVVNGNVQLRVPPTVIRDKAASCLRRGKPESRSGLTNLDDHEIIKIYGAEYRGIVQYYMLAIDVYKFNRLQWVMQTSMLKTLAHKHKSTVSKMARRYKAKVETPYGLRTCMESRIERNGGKPLIARFGGIPLHRKKNAVLDDRGSNTQPTHRRRQLVTRLIEGRCEICDSTEKIVGHHIRRLSDLERPGQPRPMWAALMVAKRRTSLIVCQPCHEIIHRQQPVTLTQ